MTKIILVFVLYLISIIGFSQNENSEINKKENLVSIKAFVNNVSSNNGKVVFGIYSKEGFLVKPIQSINAVITERKSSIIFRDMPKGEYSIVCFHDKNENHKMDFSENGMPLEDYGVSTNNVSFGPPQFEATKFEVTNKDLTFEIEF